MIGFTERLERFGRAQTVQAKDWCTEDERFSMGGGGGSVVVIVVEELGLKWEVGGLGIWEIEGCRGESEKNWGPREPVVITLHLVRSTDTH